MLPMLPMLLVDVVKFAVGSWSGRSASCASFSIMRRPAFLPLCVGRYVWGRLASIPKQFI